MSSKTRNGPPTAINRDYGRRPYAEPQGTPYQDIMERVSAKRFRDLYPNTREGEFEKPYLMKNYPQMMYLHNAPGSRPVSVKESRETPVAGMAASLSFASTCNIGSSIAGNGSINRFVPLENWTWQIWSNTSGVVISAIIPSNHGHSVTFNITVANSVTEKTIIIYAKAIGTAITGGTILSTYSTFQALSAGASFYFPGNESYTLTPDSASWNLTDYAVEFWVLFNSFDPAAEAYALFPLYSGKGTGEAFHVEHLEFHYYHDAETPGNCMILFSTYCTAALGTLMRFQSLSLLTWYHMAVVRSYNAGSNLSVWKLYVDGVNDNTTDIGTISGVMPFPDIIYGTQVGWSPVYEANPAVTPSPLNGYIDEVEVSNYAKWTANFTPPTAPSTPGANTVFLLRGNAFVDSSPNAQTVTPYGSVAINNSVYKF